MCSLNFLHRIPKLQLLLLSLLVLTCKAQDDDEGGDEPTGLKCAPGSDGLFKHPEFCDRYFECRGGQLVKRKQCEDGLVFDPDKNPEEDPCDHIHNVKDRCKPRPKLQTPKPGDGYCPRQNGVYPSPDEGECDRFYSCLNGVGSSQQCAEGLHFDPSIGTCVWARESTRKGCLSANKRAQQNEATKKPLIPDAEAEKEGESLSNGFKCPGGKLGVHPALPHPDSCRLYYVCLNGVVPNEAGCVSGLVFNPDTAKCDDPENVAGCEDTYETKKRTTSTTQRPNNRNNNRNNNKNNNNNNNNNNNEDTVDDLAKLLTLLSNPKLKTFLKPEIADALDTIEPDEEKDGPSPRQVNLTGGRRRKKRPQQQQQPSEEEFETATEAIIAGEVNVRPVPSSRRNVFTSKFIPKVKPVGNLENVRAVELDLGDEEEVKEPLAPSSPPPPPPPPPTSAPAPTPAAVEEVAEEKAGEEEPEEQPRSPQNSRFRFPRPPQSAAGAAAKSSRFQRPPIRRRKPGSSESEPEKKEEVSTEKPVSEKPISDEEKMIAELGEEMIKSLLAADPDSPKSDSDAAVPDGEFKTDL